MKNSEQKHMTEISEGLRVLSTEGQAHAIIVRSFDDGSGPQTFSASGEELESLAAEMQEVVRRAE